MNGVFLENLPRYDEGRLKGNINWNRSIGCNVNFVYNNIEDKVKIISYDKKTQYLTIMYGSEEFPITSSGFQKCSFGKILNRYTKNFKIEVGTVFKDDKRDLIVLSKKHMDRIRKPDEKCRIYNENEKWYKYKCNKCGWDEGWIRENHLLNGIGCSCCSGRTAVLGINTIWDTDRWMCDLGVSEEDAKKYTRSSNQKIDIICPKCGNKKVITVNKTYNRKSIACVCGDGFSYNEKLMHNMLKQLNVNFETQYNPEYLKPKRSDFYLPDYNLVIETDGGIGHRGGKAYGKSNKTLEELIEIDKWKDSKHLEHGIKTIRINCFESNLEYIKNNILKSELVDIFDLSKLDLLKCEEFAIKSNIVKEVCDYWNSKEEWETTEIIGSNNSWGIKSGKTIRRYLNKGVKLGWCNYNSNEELKKRSVKVGKLNGKTVEVFKNSKSLGVFESCAELSRQSEELFGIKFNTSNIVASCKKAKLYKGFVFKYKGD